MDFDERTTTPHQYGSGTMEQTLTAPLNDTVGFLGGGNGFDQTVVDIEQLLDEHTRELLKFGFKKVAKKNDYIRIEEIGDAFRHSGQNPSNDIVKDMIEKAQILKKPTDPNDETDDHLSYADFLTIVHEYWYPIDEDKQQLQEAFDILDPECKAKLMVDDFKNLLRNSDWPEDEIELILAQVSCGDGYFLYDDLIKLLMSPVDLPKKKSAKTKGSAGKKKKA